MTELYLIAHICRGEPTFDIAERIICPECRTYEYVESIAVAESSSGCDECDGSGFWWILSTPGYRAHPYWTHRLLQPVPKVPEGIWPDVFACNDLLKSTKPDKTPLFQRLGLHKLAPITRRI